VLPVAIGFREFLSLPDLASMTAVQATLSSGLVAAPMQVSQSWLICADAGAGGVNVGPSSENARQAMIRIDPIHAAFHLVAALQRRVHMRK
jgi:hypothetical protein